MSLHWTLIAGFLYAEIGALLLLLLPFISPRMWNKLIKSKLLKGIENQFIYYFYVLVTILILFFLDAIREMRKYSEEQFEEGHSHGQSHLDVQMQTHMRLFRAQRNFYISGFALLLTLVIRRMVGLLASNATLDVEREAAMKQAKSASKTAETLLESAGNASDAGNAKELAEKLEKAEKDLSKALKDVDSMKTQSENLTNEYDRLLEEKDKLERRLAVFGDGDKKRRLTNLTGHQSTMIVFISEEPTVNQNQRSTS